MNKKLKLNVKGMHCAACEVLIERKLKKVHGVHDVSVSRANEQVNIECSEHVSLEELQKAVKHDGYALSTEKSEKGFIAISKEKFLHIGAALIIIAGVYLFLSKFNLLPDNLGISDNMSYGFVFALGLIAATSTCLAVSGGLLLAISAKYSEANISKKDKLTPHIYFNAGRILSYSLFGALIGLIGSALTLSPKISGVISLIASLLMIIVGLQLLDIFPWMNKIRILMPKSIAHKIYGATDSKVTKTSAFLFGASTFFLPCGFTQALQLYVLSKADPLTGFATMLVFVLGTLPSFLAIGAVTSMSKGKTHSHLLTFSAVLVIILGFASLSSGFNLTGFVGAQSQQQVTQSNQDFIISNGKQIVNMEVIGLDYYPSSFNVKKGIPVEWNIDGSKAVACTSTIAIPSLNILKRLDRNGITTISFTPAQEGAIAFTCGMGMAGPGYFNVVSDSSTNTIKLGAANNPSPPVQLPSTKKSMRQRD